MSTITVAVIIVAAFLAWVVRFLCNRARVPDEVSYALGILVALLVFAAGPVVLG
jgi:fucose permease